MIYYRGTKTKDQQVFLILGNEYSAVEIPIDKGSAERIERYASKLRVAVEPLVERNDESE